jgi:hypothetical protein
VRSVLVPTTSTDPAARHEKNPNDNARLGRVARHRQRHWSYMAPVDNPNIAAAVGMSNFNDGPNLMQRRNARQNGAPQP